MKKNMITNDISELCLIEEETEVQYDRVFSYVINNKRAKGRRH